ncbi:MAG: hypothetical protein NVS3B10_19080 [Polyangiales bacterium]
MSDRTEDRVIKRCSCCGAEFTVAGWLALALVGLQRDDEPHPTLELRACSCRSTLSIPTPPPS